MVYERSFDIERGGTANVSTGDPRNFKDVDHGRIGRVYVHVSPSSMTYEEAHRLANALLEIAATARYNAKNV